MDAPFSHLCIFFAQSLYQIGPWTNRFIWQFRGGVTSLCYVSLMTKNIATQATDTTNSAPNTRQVVPKVFPL